MEEIAVAVVGYGLAGEVFHAPLIAAARGMRLKAVVTAAPDRGLRARQRFPGVLVFPTLEELLSARLDLRLLVVATPNHLHLRHALAAMEAGVNVVVDKPMALSVAEAEQMIAAAERHHLLLSVFQNRRLDDDFLLLQRVVRAGRLGEVHRLESRFERWRPELTPGSWREELTPAEGGGLLLDLGSHLIDQALVLFGRPLGVYAELVSRRGARAEDDCFVSLAFPRYRYAHLWMSAVAPALGPRFRLLGDRAALLTFGLDPQEEQLRSGLRPGAPGFGGRGADGAEILSLGQSRGQGEPVPFPAGRYADFYPEMAAAISGRGPLPVPPEAGLQVLQVVEAARASAESGTRVRLPPG